MKIEAAEVMKFEIGEIQRGHLAKHPLLKTTRQLAPFPPLEVNPCIFFVSPASAQKSAMAGQPKGWGLGFAHLQDQRRVSSSLDFLGSIH